jgi:hypothetical protein
VFFEVLSADLISSSQYLGEVATLFVLASISVFSQAKALLPTLVLTFVFVIVHLVALR